MIDDSLIADLLATASQSGVANRLLMIFDNLVVQIIVSLY